MNRALLAALAGCALPVLAAQDVEPKTRRTPAQKPTSRPAARPAGQAARATGTPDALALARRVHRFAGGAEGWRKVKNLVFTFLGRRRIFWDVESGKVRIETMSQPGRRPGRGAAWGILVYDIAKDAGESLVGNPGMRGASHSARSIWINDTYWLLVALKVLDPGVRLSIDEREDDDAKGVQRLRLAFAKVGLTPQNEYVLHVEDATGKVVQWDFYRDAEASPRSWRFADYRRIGPLTLSLSRPMLDAPRRVFQLSDVAINITPPRDVWTAKKPLLAPSGKATPDKERRED